MPPFFQDYKSIIRTDPKTDLVPQLKYDEYLDHVNYVQKNYPGKMQLLLQQTNGKIMPSYLVKKYIGLGFNNFCVGSIEQAKIIREINPKLKIVGSIAMHIDPVELENNYEEYKKYFDSFVLDFTYCKNFLKIKILPKGFEYILLTNSRCNKDCDGDHHWWGTENIYCPGILNRNIDFYNSCLIRPMDLDLFDPYIKVFKIQDRGWKTEWILREVVIYSTDYHIYPNLQTTASIYLDQYN